MMQLPINYYLMLGMALLTPWTSQLKMDMVLSDTSPRDSSELLSNTLMKSRHVQVPRNKRAIGLLLQGLVQALGYNTTPIQISSIANVNNNSASSAGLPNIDTRILNQSPIQVQKPGVNNTPPVPSSMKATRQRETLKFTGVVNFGNNTDLLSHLRQYEILFHGSSTTSPQSSSSTAAPNVATSSIAPNIPSPTSIPSQPNLVPIPIDLMPNIQYPKPLLSIVTASSINIRPMSDSSRYPEKDTTQNDDNDNSEESYEEDTEEHQNNYPGADDYNDDSTRSKEQSDHQYVINIGKENDERNINASSKQTERYKIIPNEESRETLYEYSTMETFPHDSQVEKSPFKYPTKYMLNRYTGNSDGFGEKLPIDNEPFHGQLMNSYGESLEHSGKIDESVADYFARFKNPRSGIFEQPRIDVFQHYGEKLSSTERYFQQPISVGRTPQMYADEPHVGFKYEEYKLNNNQESDELQAPSYVKNKNKNQLPRDEKQSRTYQLGEYIPNDNSQLDEFPRSLMNYEIRTSHDKASTIRRIPNERFHIHKFSPYYKPIQYIFKPESEESISPKIIPYPSYIKNLTRIDKNVMNLREKSVIPLTRDSNLDHHVSQFRVAPMSADYEYNRGTTMQPIIDITSIEY